MPAKWFVAHPALRGDDGRCGRWSGGGKPVPLRTRKARTPAYSLRVETVRVPQTRRDRFDLDPFSVVCSVDVL